MRNDPSDGAHGTTAGRSPLSRRGRDFQARPTWRGSQVARLLQCRGGGRLRSRGPPRRPCRDRPRPRPGRRKIPDRHGFWGPERVFPPRGGRQTAKRSD